MKITIADAMGYIAALLVFTTFWMKTMIPLRVLGLGSNIFFIAYGFLAPAYPPLVLHILLLPLNIVRLREMLRLTRRVEQATAGNNNMDWIKPFTSTRWMSADEILFCKGDTADRCLSWFRGAAVCSTAASKSGLATVVGELALVSPDKARTQTLKCQEGGELLEISYGHVKQLYFQNPVFGFYFLELTSQRLFNNVRRLEGKSRNCVRAWGKLDDKSGAETDLPRSDIS